MLQYILVYLIIALTVGYIVYSVVRSLKSKSKSPCDGCGGCDIKKEILKNVKPSADGKINCYH